MREGICRECGKFAALSQHGLCDECGVKRMRNSIAQMRGKSGEIYERWKREISRSVRRVRR